jgi:hypothetical protein
MFLNTGVWKWVCSTFFVFFISVHQFELRTGLNRTVENQFFPILFSSQFGSGKLVKVRFMVQQKVPRTGLN